MKPALHAQAFVGAMPRVRPHYAVKCNPHGGLVRALAGLGCGFDCASAAEIRQALATGVHPADIIFAHTCKLPRDIRFAASVGVHVRRLTCSCIRRNSGLLFYAPVAITAGDAPCVYMEVRPAWQITSSVSSTECLRRVRSADACRH